MDTIGAWSPPSNTLFRSAKKKRTHALQVESHVRQLWGVVRGAPRRQHVGISVWFSIDIGCHWDTLEFTWIHRAYLHQVLVRCDMLGGVLQCSSLSERFFSDLMVRHVNEIHTLEVF